MTPWTAESLRSGQMGDSVSNRMGRCGPLGSKLELEVSGAGRIGSAGMYLCDRRRERLNSSRSTSAALPEPRLQRGERGLQRWFKVGDGASMHGVLVASRALTLL